ncbi:ModD protein [Pasteurellaceae bacterium LIM206]|nr:ModD protein [Pasteurellaceae bacterium LIM206]
MLYFSRQELDELLLEDIYRGDLTTRALALEDIPARISFKRKNAGIAAGIEVAAQLLKLLNIAPHFEVKDGQQVTAGTLLFSAEGPAARLQQAWKAVQLVLEWSCGVAQYTAEMVQRAKAVNPHAIVACTRKSIPGTRKLATAAILAGGGHIHRQGLSESILVFTNHRNLLEEPENYAAMVQQLKLTAPEHKITLEADNLTQFEQMLSAKPDIIQLDKFTPLQVKVALELKQHRSPDTVISIAGGINKHNIADYAQLGISLFISSAPYYAEPEDIKVVIEKL